MVRFSKIISSFEISFQSLYTCEDILMSLSPKWSITVTIVTSECFHTLYS